MAYFWPLILVVASNSVYHICAKSLPESVDPLASLTVTYLIGSIVSGVVCGGHRDDFGVHWVSCLPRGHHGQQARGPCAVPCRAVFPQQMSCAAAFAVV